MNPQASSEYRLFVTEECERALAALPSREARFRRAKLVSYVYPQLRQNPSCGRNNKKLQGCRPETWRCRIGKSRVFFRVDPEERVVARLTVGCRRDA